MNKSHYELTFIIDGNVPENENAKICEQIKDLLTSNTGDITFFQELGRKKLSYEIKGVAKGTYFVIELEAEPSSIKTIERDLKLNKSILRYIIVKKPRNIAQIKPENVKTEFKTEEERREQKNKERDSIRAERKETRREAQQEVKEEKVEETIETKEEKAGTATKEVVEAKEEIKEEKVEEKENSDNKDDLDKKLDEILNKDEF